MQMLVHLKELYLDLQNLNRVPEVKSLVSLHALGRECAGAAVARAMPAGARGSPGQGGTGRRVRRQTGGEGGGGRHPAAREEGGGGGSAGVPHKLVRVEKWQF